MNNLLKYICVGLLLAMVVVSCNYFTQEKDNSPELFPEGFQDQLQPNAYDQIVFGNSITDNGVRPRTFTEETTPEGDEEFYSQAGGVEERISLTTLDDYFESDNVFTARYNQIGVSSLIQNGVTLDVATFNSDLIAPNATPSGEPTDNRIFQTNSADNILYVWDREDDEWFNVGAGGANDGVVTGFSGSGSTRTVTRSNGLPNLTLNVADNDNSATNEIELPNGGSNGQILSTDGSGNYSWVNDQVGSGGGSSYQNLSLGNAFATGINGEVSYSSGANTGTLNVDNSQSIQSATIITEGGSYELSVVDASGSTNTWDASVDPVSGHDLWIPQVKVYDFGSTTLGGNDASSFIEAQFDEPAIAWSGGTLTITYDFSDFNGKSRKAIVLNW
ncbi:MAG: hypothetical protein AAGI23_09400 [Bacteroidota bacterium]